MLKQIPNFPNYFVSREGQVYSIKSKKFLKPKKHRGNYLYVQLYKEDKSYNKTIHRLVAETFIKKTDEDLRLNRNCIDHIDGNRQNNHVSNLRWCSVKENNNFTLAKANKSKAKLGNQYALGSKRSEETKEKIRKALKGNQNAPSKPITIDGVEYRGIREASRQLNISSTTIYCRLNSKNFKNYQYLPQF
jgi:hypothetical protein